MIPKKVVYNVQCENKHIFPVVFGIIDDTPDFNSKKDAYCLECEKKVLFIVKSRLCLSKTIIKKFQSVYKELQFNDLGKD
ncbi:MAG: hypothetical protein L3V56_13010 [Candidatus Magnetoovum sp. WYHC-5]|nr:hypothetical protein [Candidatus Magnetoovum sp. WYHC-5]